MTRIAEIQYSKYSSTQRARQLLAQRASLLGLVFVLLKVLVPGFQR